MTSSLITLPVRIGLRGAQLGLWITTAVTDRALRVVGAVADAASPGDPSSGFDLDGRPFSAMPATPPPPAPAAPHVSTEPDLVASVAEPDAEDGAGATIRVDARSQETPPAGST